MARWLLLNSSELLGFLCVGGIVATAFRWRVAPRRDFLLAFIIFLAGTFLHQFALHLYGPQNWPDEALLAATAARMTQILGSVLFVRAAMRERCGEWGWMIVLAAATAAALIV